METYNALSMITKAGVPANKIAVGVASYGRQFRMADPLCVGKNCTFTGPESTATPGRCTNTSEYISYAEINEIVKTYQGAKVFDNGDNSKTLVYSGNWVSYMDEIDKVQRSQMYQNLRFGGTVDWAIDLIEFDHDNSQTGNQITLNHGYGSSRQSCGIAGFELRRGWESCLPRIKGTADCVNDESWRSIDCTNKGIADYHLSASEKWFYTKADSAWCAGLKNWEKMLQEWRASGIEPIGQKSFTQELTQFYNRKAQMRCEVLGTSTSNNHCAGPDQCLGPESTTGAATQHILQSLGNIYEVRKWHMTI
jgi:hypothetical protein